jgi:hypothetical protein
MTAGTDGMVFKNIPPKHLAKILAFFAKNNACFFKKNLPIFA